MKLLMCFDGPAACHLSQMNPLAKCFKEYEIDCIVLNPVTFQLVDRFPFVSNIIPIKIINEQITILSRKDGLEATTDYYYNNRYNKVPDDFTIGKELKERLADYDKILLLYDGKFTPVIKVFDCLINACKEKFIGRCGDWRHECKPHNPNEFIPKDVVEAFGFNYDDSLMKLEYDWYQDFDPQINLSKNSICLVCSGFCESFIPDSRDRTFKKGASLRNLLVDMGFQVVTGNIREDIRRQIFYAKCTYMITVDSVGLWTRRCFNTKENVFVIQQPLYEFHDRQLGYDFYNLEPQGIADLFKDKINISFL